MQLVLNHSYAAYDFWYRALLLGRLALLLALLTFKLPHVIASAALEYILIGKTNRKVCMSHVPDLVLPCPPWVGVSSVLTL